MRRPHPHRVPLLLVVAVTALLAGACADEAGTTTTGRDPAPSPDTTIGDDGWRGVLLDARLDWLQLADGTMVEDVSSFTPTEADARRFEEQLPAALDEAVNPSGEGVTVDDLDGYVRQYTGVAGGGFRHLVVAGICDGERFPEWRHSWIVVNDGGACFWDATLDLDTGEIIRLSFHGSA